VQVRDIEEIDRILKRNREEHARMRMPRYEQELQGLFKSRRKVELTDTLF
jgi:hypothetical protein